MRWSAAWVLWWISKAWGWAFAVPSGDWDRPADRVLAVIWDLGDTVQGERIGKPWNPAPFVSGLDDGIPF